MSRLRWDQMGDHRYETGLDRGVLYLSDGTGVPWSGLTSLDEDVAEEKTTPAYFDGVKYADIQSFSDFAATLTAFTYPDEFLEYEGIVNLGNGLFVDGQDHKLFGLSYRTRLGNDIRGHEYGYKIHLVYNLTAVPEEGTAQTIGESVSPRDFSWKISGLPMDAPGYKPTAHVIFDSRLLNVDLFASIEALLYGDDDDDAHLPSIEELIEFVSLFGPKTFTLNNVTGLNLLTPGGGDLTPSNIDGLYVRLPSSRLVDEDEDGYFTFVP